MPRTFLFIKDLCYCSEVFPLPRLASRHSYNSDVPLNARKVGISHPIYSQEPTNRTQALKPFRLPAMKPEAWTIGAFRVSVHFQVASCSIRRSKSSMASHSCRYLVNNLQEISGKPKDEGIWEAGSLKFSVSDLPLAWYSWKKTQRAWTSQAMSLHGV